MFKDQIDTLQILSKITSRPVAEIIREGIALVLRENEHLIKEKSDAIGGVKFIKKQGETYVSATDLAAMFKSFDYESVSNTIKTLVQEIKKGES